MVTFKNLCHYTEDNDKRKRKYTRRNNLNIIERFRLGRIDDLMRQIVSKIENESGWEYVGDSFVFPSDFAYTDNDITFKTNRVSLGAHDLDDMSEKEILFLERYGALIKQLKELDDKRQKYMYPNDVKSIDAFRTGQIMKSARSDMDGYLSHMYTQFLLAFPQFGTEGFVHALNVVHDAPNNRAAREALKKEPINSLLNQELLKWISSFSRRGNILFENYQHDLVAAQIRREVKGIQPIMHTEAEINLGQFK